MNELNDGSWRPFGAGTTSVDAESSSTDHGVSLASACRVWAYIGLNSFGGPTGQVAVMHKVLVDQNRWISEERFLHALNYCMLLPGPEAMQLATYVGWLMHRTLGGLIAGTLFVLPGFISILVLSIAYTQFRDLTLVQGLLFGLKAAVIAIVAEAVIRIGRKVLRNRVMYIIAAISFVAIFFFGVPFPAIILSAGAIGFIGDRFRPDLFEVLRFKQANNGAPQTEYLTDHAATPPARPALWRTVSTLLIWGALWFTPVVLLHAWAGPTNVFAAQSWFFSKAAVVTFGGAYAVLAYIAQQAVEVYHWLEPGEMLTGLGMAESTPGPLIQVVQFVGYMGAYRDPGELDPVVAGVVSSVLTTWVTFAPCFLWIFVGAPYVEYIRGKRSLTAALSTITASVVGVVLNLSVWFALHTLFGELVEGAIAGARFPVPVFSTIDIPALLIAAMAALLIFRWHWGVLQVLGVSVVLGSAWTLWRSAI
ncbi:MAG: chromate efflux transporter [Phycisphaerales bacterium]